MDEAEDIVQDLFVKLITKRDFQNIKNIQAYLKTAVRNASFKRINLRKKLIPLIDEAVMDSNTNSVEQQQVTEENLKNLNRAIENLPDRCKIIFLMCVVEGLSYIAVAETLEISVNTVKSQIKKAYKTLRENTSYSNL